METEYKVSFFHNNIQFKSYYVVWKPQVGCEDINMSSRFKSYYVVWKHFEDDHYDSDVIYLNRTMQYGNFFV